VERESLARLLEQGLSVERIAPRFGKHPSTVSYWMEKYGLEAVNREKHAAKGGIERELLERLVAEGNTIAEIAKAVSMSKSAVRHWLGRYGLRTRNRVGPRLGQAARSAKDAGRAQIVSECIHHGETEYVLEGRGYYRCKRCRSAGIAEHRRRLKRLMVEEAGGCCQLCGYSGSLAALHFHHLDPLEKRLGISANGLTLSLASLRTEVAKCVLLCSNCHAEVENGVTTLPVELSRRIRGGDPE
jgi:transposase